MGVLLEIAFGAIFVVSGALKWRDPSWPAAAQSLGTPPSLVHLVPPIELVVGGLVIAGIATPLPVLAGLALLVVFTGALVRVVRRPNPPVCACFGAWSAAPVSWRSIARNLGFVALGVVALAV